MSIESQSVAVPRSAGGGDETTIMREALRVIANPIGHFQRYARERGLLLDGRNVLHLASDAGFLSGIAKQALDDAVVVSRESPAVLPGTGGDITAHPDLGEPRKCLVCGRVKPWGTFDPTTGATACVDCRDAGQARAAQLRGVGVASCRDAARLAFVERMSCRVEVFDPPSGDAWVWEVGNFEVGSAGEHHVGADDAPPVYGNGPTLRDAIDAAMSSLAPSRDGATDNG